ncbi:MAG: hypothetical protein K0S23_2293 [Fluviicola sp.]|jgi:hypothetical protein|uniref:hypothetical protein n=1 Tax=Fluviicola sp. TaxID=1917219 RepID=UPI00262571FB|nr:hypothetical protein [Fluviicola sp.]MDF3027986.1 hypothetical protein [Fluviicola sp.]
MKKNSLTLFLGGVTVIGLAVLTNCTSGTDTEVESGYETSSSPDSLCLVDPSWFPHSQTPAPQEGPGSPFDTSSTTNQIFHQWSWNKFLWLTKPDQGGNPLFLNQSKVQQVTSHMATVNIPSGAMVVLQDTAQAGSESAVLQTNPDYNNGTGAMVYYSIHMNPLMYNAGLNFASMIKNGQLPATNEASFPVGSFELKVAWVPLSAIPAAKQSEYYTTTASLSTNNGASFTNTQVALIGMHVVGVVQNHPEFIWATFEHDDLSPDYNWEANSASSATDQLLFKNGTVSGLNGILYDSDTELGETPYQVYDLFQYGIPRNSDGTFMNTSQSEPADFQNVDGINQCVKSQLDDVWANYFYNGSIWLNTDGKTPLQQAQLIDSLAGNISNATPGSFARGSLNCANVTMETFTQTFETSMSGINAGNLANCFSCHSGQSFSYNGDSLSPVYLSHTFQEYLLEQQGSSFKKAESIKSKAEQRVLKRMQKK